MQELHVFQIPDIYCFKCFNLFQSIIDSHTASIIYIHTSFGDASKCVDAGKRYVRKINKNIIDESLNEGFSRL